MIVGQFEFESGWMEITETTTTLNIDTDIILYLYPKLWIDFISTNKYVLLIAPRGHVFLV